MRPTNHKLASSRSSPGMEATVAWVGGGGCPPGADADSRSSTLRRAYGYTPTWANVEPECQESVRMWPLSRQEDFLSLVGVWTA